MKIKYWSIASDIVISSLSGAQAQQKKHLELNDVLRLAFSQSNQAKVLDAGVYSHQLEYEVAKDGYLPEAKLSGSVVPDISAPSLIILQMLYIRNPFVQVFYTFYLPKDRFRCNCHYYYCFRFCSWFVWVSWFR